MTTEVSRLNRCYWCRRGGSGPDGGGCIRNGFMFCWVSTVDESSVCAKILDKMDTMIDNHECPVCLEIKTALELPNCKHKCCLDCYKKIYFGVSEHEKPCIYTEHERPEWTYGQQVDEYGNIEENTEMKMELDEYLLEKMNYDDIDDERSYDELIEARDNLIHERPEWMNNIEVINYENEEFRISSEFKNKDIYRSRLIKSNCESCPLCRK